MHPTNRKGKLIGHSPRRGGQSERQAAPSLSNVALAFQNRTLRDVRGGADEGGAARRACPASDGGFQRVSRYARVPRYVSAQEAEAELPSEGSRPARPPDPGQPDAGVGAPIEKEKGGGYWKLPGISPTCLTALASSWGPESETVPEQAKSSQPCYRIHVALNGAFSPPSKLTPLRSLPAIHAHHQLQTRPDSAVCQVRAVSLFSLRSRVLVRLYLGWRDCSLHP